MADINIHRSTPQIDIDTSSRNYHLPIASATTLGGIKVGNNLTIEEDGTLNAESTEYNLPVASSSTLGGVKIGSGLTIADAVASVNVDSTLDADSANPLRNSVITSNLNTLTSSVQTAESAITSLSTTVGTLSGTVSTNTSNISTLSSTVSGHTTAIQANTDNISTQATSISNNTYAIGQLDNRLISAEASITTMSDSLDALTADDILTLQPSDLSPVSTWTTGNINVVKRGKVGYLFIDLDGSLTIAADSSEVIYTFTDLIPLIKASSALLTDGGAVIGEFDDYTYNLSLINLDTQHSITITKVKGCIPVVFA